MVSAAGPTIPADIAALMKAFNITQELAEQLKLTLGAKKS
jgi:hypothetical protein